MSVLFVCVIHIIFNKLLFKPNEHETQQININDPAHDKTYNPVSILRKSISGRHRPVRVADGPMTARCRFT